MDEQNTQPEALLRWSFSAKKDRSANWYIIAGTVLLSFVFWGAFNGMGAMSAALLVFAGVYTLVDTNSADSVNVALSQNGFFVDRSFYDFPQISTFCILYDHGEPVAIRLRFKTTTLKQMDLYGLEQINVPELRQFLLQFLEEDASRKIGMDDKIISQLKL